jgi:putative SOS response-associated peptidase YedK
MALPHRARDARQRFKEDSGMCGRMVLTRSASELAAEFSLAEIAELMPRYNIAPSQPIGVIRVDAEGQRDLSLLHWGLIPSWAKDRAIGNRMINARAETAAEKPSFRTALRRRRCIVPADGFYEWQQVAAESAAGAEAKGGKKPKPARIPHLFKRPDGASLAIAGLWETWTDRETGEHVESCTLLTTEANALVRPIHHRMPVILESPDWALWLDPRETEAEAVLGLLVPASPDRLNHYAVSSHVNDPRNEDPSCIVPR